MDELPEITDVKRLRLEPGDALVVRADEHALTEADAGMLKGRVRAILGLPDDFPVLVLARGMDVEVVSDGSGRPG